MIRILDRPLKERRFLATTAVMLSILAAAWSGRAVAQEKKTGKHPPVTVSFYLTGVEKEKQQEAIRDSLAKLKTASALDFGSRGEYVTVQFDSHVVSYHQIAQAIADAGTQDGKQYDPRVKVRIPEYSQADHAAKVDAIFAGKRLNQRVRIASVDKTRGEFLVRFLPLVADQADTAPQGFNGGHLHHPIHDPPPRGLGLDFRYVTEAHPDSKAAD